MPKNFKLTFLFSFFLLISHFQAHTQIENQTLEKIEVIIHKKSGATEESQAILSRMSTKKGAIFSQTDFDEDLKALSLDYDRVEPLVEVNDNKISMTLHLWPKPIIRSIEFRGNNKVVTNRLRRELSITPFSTFERQTFNTAFHKLKAYYTRKGFFEAVIDFDVVSCSDSNEVDIIIDIKEGRSGKIQKIIFENFSEKEEHEILEQMVTKKYNIFMSWYTQEGVYNEEAVEQDKLIITNYLQNEGYADAVVDITITEGKADRILVTITADKGERYYYGKLSFEGNNLITSEAIDRLFLIRPGEPFSLEDIRETIQVLTDAYGKYGYIDAIVDFEPRLVSGEYKYDIHFKFTEGEQYRVGLIRVFGNTITQTPVILHETLLVPGEIFNIIKLKRTEERLKNIGYFKNVNVYIVKGTESSQLGGNYRDVYIEVEETTTGQFNAFVGYSSVEEIFGGFNVTERNFNYKGFNRLGRDGLSAMRGGGEYVNFTAQIGQKSRSYVFSWTKPYFMDTKWTVGFDIAKTSTRYISRDYDLETASLNLRAQYDVNAWVRFGMHYRLKNGYVNLYTHGDSSSSSCESDDHSKDPRAMPDLNALADKRAGLRHAHSSSSCSSHEEGIHQLRKEADIRGLISAVGTSLAYDSTDHPVKPSQGLRSRFSIEFAGVGGDHTFFNVGYLNTYYLAVGSRTVLKYRADFRFIQPVGSTRYSTLPLDERIFLGGDYMVRGYRPYRLGPQYEGTHDPRGGLSLQLYSVELNRRIIENVEAFTFLDAGYLSKYTWDFGRMSVAVGFGINFKLIDSIPPITLGMGYPLNPKNRSEVKKFFISVGGVF